MTFTRSNSFLSIDFRKVEETRIVHEHKNRVEVERTRLHFRFLEKEKETF